MKGFSSYFQQQKLVMSIFTPKLRRIRQLIDIGLIGDDVSVAT